MKHLKFFLAALALAALLFAAPFAKNVSADGDDERVAPEIGTLVSVR